MSDQKTTKCLFNANKVIKELFNETEDKAKDAISKRVKKDAAVIALETMEIHWNILILQSVSKQYEKEGKSFRVKIIFCSGIHWTFVVLVLSKCDDI